MNVGIIGTGNMGTILLNGFIRSNAVKPSELTVTNRSMYKAYELKNIYPDLKVVETAKEVITASDIVLVCVKPLEIQPLLSSLQKHFTKKHCVISITSPINVEQLEAILPCQVARVIPSITNQALSGVTLVNFGKRCTAKSKEQIIELFSNISKPVMITEDITRVSSDIASCGPAFFSYLLQKFIDAAVCQTSISKEQATILAEEMIIGFGKLIEQKHFTLETLQEKVCVKGGITGEGIKVLEARVGDLFEEIFEKTHDKFDKEIERVKEQF
ncbi:late competence protein ComER [Bacillus sp. AFS053548]|uniref:late competence protein ComER n=1 Tax=Bacillus sp. AFS053548 TaxID=2033505 RepID=UPI000BFEA075|nr:late competence protein ComER [Bacillus sp. AFS053548]PGM57874.1 late competence protein ComER [Bacillus sp. AFS053548]